MLLLLSIVLAILTGGTALADNWNQQDQSHVDDNNQMGWDVFVGNTPQVVPISNVCWWNNWGIWYTS